MFLFLIERVCCGVENLTPYSLDSFLNDPARSRRPVLLKFFTDWCGHCQKLAPVYTSVSKKLSALATFAQVDGSLYTSLVMRFGVGGYPTIFHISRNGNSSSWEVRPVPLSLFDENGNDLKNYLEGGWNRWEALSGWKNPWSVMGLAKFYPLLVFELLTNSLVPVLASYDVPMPGTIVQFFFILALLCSTSSALICCSVCWGGSKRASRRRPLKPSQ